MKASILGLFFCAIGLLSSFAQTSQVTSSTTTPTKAGQEIIDLSKQKWQWMADKNVDKLAVLFHDESKFVHMSGTWKKNEELEIIKTGSIWYKQADVHDVAVELFDETAIIWSRITLVAMVRGSEVKTEFTVTEVYKKQRNAWKLLALTFSSVRDTHSIKH
ncbi:MAG: nuclear transport factor 2 family protein [Chitinophagaceae bacterium]|nr:MAG: nuclear transport factor 2 family protein [Chitinophagaceae bacterium]